MMGAGMSQSSLPLDGAFMLKNAWLSYDCVQSLYNQLGDHKISFYVVVVTFLFTFQSS